MKKWLLRLKQVLKQMAEQPEQKLSEATILLPEEEEALVKVFNATERPYREDQTVVELFEEQALRTPDAIGLRVGGEAAEGTSCARTNSPLTYRELSERVRLAAQALKQRGVGQGG